MHSGASFCPFVEITCSFVTGFSAPMEGFFPVSDFKSSLSNYQLHVKLF